MKWPPGGEGESGPCEPGGFGEVDAQGPRDLAGLAAQVALRACDRQGPPIRFQLLNETGLDDRSEYITGIELVVDGGISLGAA
ncbi:alpha/beta hydrolase [Sphaerisporangium fuscum]|uniref:alpha/beta hydrolase n=1 Tax=Sphaerisporangium fuscum TaxID=2835868 RepID=UPI002029A71B|nr:alpha/beta hydrolase [Sphaerisporangium fuscum]